MFNYQNGNVSDPVYSIFHICSCHSLTSLALNSANPGLLFFMENNILTVFSPIHFPYGSRLSKEHPALLFCVHDHYYTKAVMLKGINSFSFPIENLPALLSFEQTCTIVNLLNKLIFHFKSDTHIPDMVKYSWIWEIIKISKESYYLLINQDRYQGNDTVNKVISYIEEHYMEDLNADLLSNTFFISKYHLMREFKKITGCTIHTYLMQLRISKAQLLIAKGVCAGTASSLVGFSDYSIFYRSFLKITGESPLKYKRSSCNDKLSISV